MTRRLIALLLCICMIGSMTVYATDDVTEPTSEPAVPTTVGDDALGVRETEPTVSETSEAASEPTVPETSEAASEPTVPESSEAASEPTVPETSVPAADPTEPSQVDAPAGPTVGDTIYIKSGSMTYKAADENSAKREVVFNYKTMIVSIVTDELGNAAWYEFQPTGLLQWFKDYKFVKVENTTVTDPDTPTEPTPPTDDEEVVVGGVSVKAENVPEDVTMAVQPVTTKGYSEELFEAIGSKKVVFALDIMMSRADAQWQPTEGQPVTMTLDASALGLTEGQRIGILHEHGGELKDLGICAVTDGKLTFTTDGFSTFYGYTVDFEYDGTWHSISGGSYIYLSELFEMLDIKQSVNDVTSVEFSDETLLAVTHLTYIKEQGGGQDWRLCSMQPFDTEELLTVTFTNSETITINVYDVNWGTANIAGNEAWNDGDTLGNRNVTKNSTITIASGASVTLNGSITVPEGKTLTIQCSGNATLKRASGNTGNVPLFNINGGKLIIKSTGGTITVDGNKVKVGRAAFVVGVNSRADWNTDKDNGGSTLELTNVTIKDCYSNDDSYAGAIQLIAGSGSENAKEFYRPLHNVVMVNCVIDNCRAPHGSAIYFRGNSMGKFTMTDTIIRNCVTYGKPKLDGDDQGGTIRSNGQNGSFVILERCILQNNRSGYTELDTPRKDAYCYGGGIYWNAAGELSDSYADTITPSNNRAKFYIYDCQILNNKATNRGGGIFNESAMYIGTRYEDGFTTESVSSTADIRGTLIDGNDASGYKTAAKNSGGGIMIPSYGGGADESQDMDVSLDMGKGVFVTNNTSVNGAGLSMQINYTEDKKDGVTFSIDYDGAVIQNNTASNNGGGVYIVMSYAGYNSNLNLISGTISENDAQNGGGIYVENTNINIGTDETTVDNPVRIENNTASVDGGGIYLKQEVSYADTVEINVENGFVTGNKATRYGGGIFQTGAVGQCNVSGEGKVSENTAANGGAIYVDGGSTLNVTGGIISGNTAIGTNTTVNQNITGETALGRNDGVGGGIYVMKGTFTMSGDSVGIYGNLADYAADDAYASGSATTLSLPDVRNMKLEGAYQSAQGWFIDYVSNDTNYGNSGFSFVNEGRYRTDGNTDHEAGSINGMNKYYCLTLGRIPSLVITKVLDSNKAPDHSFLFQIKDPKNKILNVVIPASAFAVNEDGKMEASATITNMVTGIYTVTELSDWSWRYLFENAIAVHDEAEVAVTDGVRFQMTVDGEEIIFTNKHTLIYWLNGDCWCENWWGGENGKIVKRDEHQNT